ncbi:hypothetical protein TNCV_1280351 [Trichonephila clavipes]|nr:hypothetical protein TNCV_1280351 [Trichonephila clavipes]
MKKFNQTPYKLPPPTPIHVPAEKRPLEEKALPKKRVRITPVMRRVSRRSELPMAPVQIPQPPVQIPDVLEPVQIPDVPLEPVQIPDVPITCADSRCPTCADSRCPTITCAYSTTTCADSRCPRATCADSTTTCADSRTTCAETEPLCADSSVPCPEPPVQIPVSQVPEPPVQILPEPDSTCADCRFQMFQNLCRFQCHKSHSHLCRFSQNL